MIHSAKGESKIVQTCTLPLTSVRRVDLIVTDMAVIEPTEDGLLLKEIAPELSVEDVIKSTQAHLNVSKDLKIMKIE